MDKNNEIILTGIVLDDSDIFTLQEIRDKFHIDEKFLDEMLEYGLFDTARTSNEDLVVNIAALKRIQTALHLHHDLDVNMAGAALVLELMDELEKLRSQAALIHKHFR